MKNLTLGLLLLALTSCGTDSPTKPAPVQPPPADAQPPAQPPAGGAVDLEAEYKSAVLPVIQKNCGGASCHSSGLRPDILTSAAALARGASDRRLGSNTMPPPGTPQATRFAAGDKALILAFIKKVKG